VRGLSVLLRVRREGRTSAWHSLEQKNALLQAEHLVVVLFTQTAQSWRSEEVVAVVPMLV
jgi:hypothetical protein